MLKCFSVSDNRMKKKMNVAPFFLQTGLPSKQRNNEELDLTIKCDFHLLLQKSVMKINWKI